MVYLSPASNALSRPCATAFLLSRKVLTRPIDAGDTEKLGAPNSFRTQDIVLASTFCKLSAKGLSVIFKAVSLKVA